MAQNSELRTLKQGTFVELQSGKGKTIGCKVSEIIAESDGGWTMNIINRENDELIFAMRVN